MKPHNLAEIGRTLVIALAYLALGGLGLIFAIAPGYASPIFPASGLALAITLILGARALPGIWLGGVNPVAIVSSATWFIQVDPRFLHYWALLKECSRSRLPSAAGFAS